MKKKSTSQSAFLNLRVLIGFFFCFGGMLMVLFPFGAFSGRDTERLARYMPVPGRRLESEAADLGRLEQFWNDRLTYPTGRFNPAWVRAAAAQHTRMPSSIPAGRPLKLNPANPLALSTTSFTALGPKPERMTGCGLCTSGTQRPKGELTRWRSIRQPLLTAAS